METRRVYIVGDTLFAETLVQMLGEYEAIEVIGSAPTPSEALTRLQNQNPDVVIVAGVSESIISLLVACPDLPVIHTDLNTNRIQVITNQTIDARISDLLTAISALPKRGISMDEETRI